ncbi:MAG TPA: glycerol-3-phosphate acyltransferase [Dehalococcoidia bacterium]|nr:glycerol-3-phosphate acyltransferase [Dehalococcoidia bacterium]
MWDEIAFAFGAYILGSFPLMYLMGRLHGIDLREYEDMHIATWRNVGRVQGFIGVIFDFAKGVIAVLIAREVLHFSDGWVAVAGVTAVAGQMWPVFLKFDGEKGNSTGLAMSGALATYAMLIVLIPVTIGFAIRTIPRFRQKDQTVSDKLKFGGPPSLSLPLGMAIAFAVLPLAAWLVGQPLEVVYAFGALSVLILLRRLTAGLSEELRQPSWNNTILLNRLLFDRSEI